jgi:hypothetical protein
MTRVLLLVLFLPLLACSPGEQCRIEASRDLRALDRMIAETEQSISRGFRVIEVDNPFRIGLTLCVDPTEESRLCGRDDGPIYRHEKINVPAEKAKLASLKAQRATLAPRTAAAIAACPRP